LPKFLRHLAPWRGASWRTAWPMQNARVLKFQQAGPEQIANVNSSVPCGAHSRFKSDISQQDDLIVPPTYSKVRFRYSRGSSEYPANHSSYARTTRAGVPTNPSRSGSSPDQRRSVRTASSAPPPLAGVPEGLSSPNPDAFS
jgi:hypothetical protein